MSIRLSKPLYEQVIVITGASSGIGLATAQMAAEKGAKLVLASRNEDALQLVCKDIKKQGGTAIYVVADVAKRDDVEKIASAAIKHFDRIDTWINDAGIGTLGRLDEISEEDHRRLFDTNFWGIVNGSLVAVEMLRKEGGTIINLGSEVSDVAVPLQGMYSASKHAVKGFTNSLRIELEEADLPISVSLIKPAAIATPFFEHAKNYTDHEFRAPAPVYSPNEVARAILHCAVHPTRELYIGGAGKMMSGLQAHMPRLYDWISEKFMFKAQQGEQLSAFAHNDNLHEAGEDGNVYGSNENADKGRASIYTRASMHPVATAAAVTGIGLLAFALFKNPHGLRKGAASLAALAAPALENPATRAKIVNAFDQYRAKARKKFKKLAA